MHPVNERKARPFRVIVVGAGIAGLTLSNALQKAGIDHVVLEKHAQVVYPSGASIGMWPNGARLLDQLGCLASIEETCFQMTVSYTRNPDGKAIIVSELFDEIVERHGHRFLLLERRQFIQALLDCLPTKDPIRTRAAVKDIAESENGVRVYLNDGSYEDGDIVVGCDGVASRVRQIMWNHANQAVPNTITPKEMQSLTASYKCLVGLSPSMPGIESGSMTVVHNNGFSFLILTQPQLIFYFVFIKLGQTYRWPSLPTYTAEDMHAEAAKIATLPINDNLTFGQIWEKRLRGDLINIEEGVFKHWHSNRIVLLGDAAHKFTPNIAFGGGSAMESAATFANILRAKLLSSKGGLSSHPTQAELSTIFQTYREQRIGRVYLMHLLSGFMTRVQAWSNPVFKFLARRCFPWMSDNMVGGIFSLAIQGGVKLDYVPQRVKPKGKVKWKVDVSAQNQSQKWLGGMGLFIVSCVLYLLISLYNR
ncbi:hypothetical protein N7536_005094 [Penicillium majusculum]|uniref:FAD-binding domain-containing protein n=1 Tax=Penicillium solitum TaxID=60172 RepID=A0A1V6Q771_9EURO|nr:uncharacterized protein PENSOL_c111G06326 [Penicillium solitum]KAJ5694682.1 hypothetical protein N7536_005094 [Penicillium majusculum]OQD84822.1 hypothetical protein PENSOL_c111G06326 [Penicillium solitum]